MVRSPQGSGSRSQSRRPARQRASRIALAWHMLHHFGPGWLAYRGSRAVRERSGSFERTLPLQPWEALPLRGYLGAKSPAEPQDYFQFRSQNRLRFFFKPDDRRSFAPLLSSFQSGAENATTTAERILCGEFVHFSRHRLQRGMPPDWHEDPFTHEKMPADRHWSRIKVAPHADIKLVWELSRFSVAYALVRAFWRTGREEFAEVFWELLESWRQRNPPQAGPNWKCGQEISFRMFCWLMFPPLS